MTSVTPADVLAFAGVEVTQLELNVATAIVEDSVGVDLGGTTLYAPRDLARLKRAVTWQALYLHEHPEVVHAQPGVTGASANGASITLEPGSTTQLAPLAERVLKGLSWRRRLKTSLPVHATSREFLSQDLVHDEGRQPWVAL